MRRTRVTRRQRETIAQRARHCCEYCFSRASFTTETFSVEHIIPQVRGGATTLDNLAFACSGCNGHKYAKISAPDPESGETVPLFHPRQQAWRDHFRWSADFQSIIGLTATGRATITALHMNRPPVQNLRRVLYLTGHHPAQQNETAL